MKKLLLLNFMAFALTVVAQTKKEGLKYYLSSDSSTYFQATFLNQAWVRYNQNNPGTTVSNVTENNTFDIGLRRTRIQLFGQVTPKVFLYFQFGQNNFNAQYNINSNRKFAAFFHDAVCEYKVSKENQLKIGSGLTITNGLSRFSQPSIGTIMTTDVPVSAQATVDQTDIFSRKLSIYARGQFKKFDYRFVLSNPFPITSSGNIPALSKNANFSTYGHHLQQQAYIMYQFGEHENHTTPYMTGTYLGKKKIFNIAAGIIHQKNAMWLKNENTNDTIYQNMTLFCIESFLDYPVSWKKFKAISAYLGYFNTNYGTNYLRYNGLMNVASGTTLNASNSITGQGPTYGNSYPMFGTGHFIFSQLGALIGSHWMPYISAQLAKYEQLNNLPTNIIHIGCNYLIAGHKSKISLDIEDRPTYKIESNVVKKDKRLHCFTVQYQIFI